MQSINLRLDESDLCQILPKHPATLFNPLMYEGGGGKKKFLFWVDKIAQTLER